MLRVAAFLMVMCVAVPATARNITSEVQYYRSIEIIFSENAHICGLKDPQPFAELAETRLSGMDVPHNPDGVVDLVITITARGSGLLKQNCTGHVLVQLQTILSSDFLDVNAYDGQDQLFTMWSQRQYAFPAIFFQTGAVFSDYAPTMLEKTKEVLAELMDNLSKARMER